MAATSLSNAYMDRYGNHDLVFSGETRTSWQEFHDEVEVHLILEAVEHLDYPQTVCLHQDVPLSTDVTDLTKGAHMHIHTGLKGPNSSKSSSGWILLPLLLTCSFSSMSALRRIFMA